MTMTVHNQPLLYREPLTNGSDSRQCPVCGLIWWHTHWCPLNSLSVFVLVDSVRMNQVVLELLRLIRDGAGEDSSEYGRALALAQSVGLLAPSEIDNQEE